jgi:uncharacterized membrane protein YphA (DoxX/SURF4 family)
MTSKVLASTAPAPVALIRLVVGWVFLSEGIQKFLFLAVLGVVRFGEIGIPDPQILAPFVGVCEILSARCRYLGYLRASRRFRCYA